MLDAIHPATDLFWKEVTSVELVMATHDVALALAAHRGRITAVTDARRA